MPRCLRENCNHFRRSHDERSGACRKKPRGHCQSFVGAPKEPTPNVIIESGADVATVLRNSDPGDVVKFLDGPHSIRSPLQPKPGHYWFGPGHLIGAGAREIVRAKISDGEGIEDVTLDGLDISGAEETGVTAWIGMSIIGGRIHHCKMRGVGGDPNGLPLDLLIDGTELDHNGSPAFVGPSAAGIKMFHAGKVKILRAKVHSNHGNGVWFDWQSWDALVDDCDIFDNLRTGAFWEKCGLSRTAPGRAGNFVVRRSRIKRNNREGSEQGHAGVRVIASLNALVEDNDFGDNAGQGIHVRNDPKRVADDKPGFEVANVTLRRNQMNGDRIIGCDIQGVTCS